MLRKRNLRAGYYLPYPSHATYGTELSFVCILPVIEACRLLIGKQNCVGRDHHTEECARALRTNIDAVTVSVVQVREGTRRRRLVRSSSSLFCPCPFWFSSFITSSSRPTCEYGATCGGSACVRSHETTSAHATDRLTFRRSIPLAGAAQVEDRPLSEHRRRRLLRAPTAAVPDGHPVHQ